jgi:hypothetical protein
MRVVIEIIKEKYLGTDMNFFDVEVRHKDKVYRKKEIIELDVLNSLFDRIFERAKLAVKECMKEENPQI